MTEYLPYVLAALPVLSVVGWYCRRWGFDDGYAEGHAEGYLKGLADNTKASTDDCGPTPNLAGGPGPVPR